MSEYPVISKQTALWFSSSSSRHIVIYKMSDRHLLGAIGVVQKYAKWEFEDDQEKDSEASWYDYVPMDTYVPLVKECLRRFLTVPGEEILRTIEIAWMESKNPSPCCCTCEYLLGFDCSNQDSEYFGTLRVCLRPCNKWKKRRD